MELIDELVTILDARSGRLLSTVAVGSEPDAAVVDERSGHVFVVNQGDGTVSMLDARSGSVVGTITVGENPGAVGMDARAGRILVAGTNADNQGSVSVLDARSGAVLRTLAVGVHPVAVAVDEQAGRAFVINFLREGAEDLATLFASKSDDKFRDVPWQPSPDADGSPILRDVSVAYAACRVTESREAGDHWIFIGSVEAGEVLGGTPLMYYRRTYAAWPAERPALSLGGTG